MDELGLMVSRIVEHDGNGFLRVTGLGGVDRRHLLGQTAVVHGVRPLTGVLGGLPDSYLPAKERDKAYSYENLVLDVGLPVDEVRRLVSIGDFVTFRQPLRQRRDGKALTKLVTAVTLCLETADALPHRSRLAGGRPSGACTSLRPTAGRGHRHRRDPCQGPHQW
jgi:endoglucanase